MENLPSEITFDIFYRLPEETLVQCKLVCKSWRSFILYGNTNTDDSVGGDANYFAKMHLRRRRRQQQQQQQQPHQGNLLEHSTLNFIAMHGSRGQEEDFIEFHITEYDDEDDHLSCKIINFPVTVNCIWIECDWKIRSRRLAGSCNGLVCLPRTYGITFLEDAIIICNPLLKEYVTLPLSDTYFQSGSMARRDIRLGHEPSVYLDQFMVIIGFGYHPCTDEYKVVRVDYGHYSNMDIGDVEVYTLGDKSIDGGMWRSKGTIDYRLLRLSTPPVLINGSLHWLALKPILHGLKQKCIVSFDLEVEEFRVIPIPNCPPVTAGSLFKGQKMELKELGGGCLCLIRTEVYHEMDIWVLKDYSNNESWAKEFSIKWEGKSWCYSPCAIKKKKNSTDGDHEILLWCDGKSGLVSYDPKTGNFEDVGGGVDVAGARRASIYWNSKNPVHHIKSLVSLKALGVDSNLYGEWSKNKSRWTRKRKKIIEGSWTRRHKLIRSIIVKAKASAYRKGKKYSVQGRGN